MALVPSSQYPAQTDSDPAYPQGKARNAGTFQDGTGTPLEKNWVNDLWGFQQALLDDAEITPSGTPDQVGASDYLDAVKRIGEDSARRALTPVLLRMRQIQIATPYADTGAAMAVRRQSNGPLMIVKAGTDGVHRMSEHDDRAFEVGSVASITSLVTGLAASGARMVAIGTGGNRCCFTTDFGANWTAGSDLGATPERIIYNSTHSRFMVTYASGANVAQDSDANSTWSVVDSGLTHVQGGIAHFSNGATIVCGYSGAAVEMARSTDGGGAWSSTSAVPNASDYSDSGTIDGDGGGYIYHAGRISASPTQLRICRADSSMSWELLATISSPGIVTFKPRILLCPDTGVLVLIYSLSGGTVAIASRDGGLTWSDPAFYQTRFNNSFGIARGRLFSTYDGDMYATDFLG